MGYFREGINMQLWVNLGNIAEDGGRQKEVQAGSVHRGLGWIQQAGA